MSDFSHLDESGRARMVDVGGKDVTRREATAAAEVRASPATLRAIRERSGPKGDVLATARLAGIMAAKRTADLIPLCHTLPLDGVEVDFSVGEDHVSIRATVRNQGRTGVEMEAMTAVSVAALTLYDMCKAIDRGMVIERVRLLAKSGGRSGTWVAPEAT